MRALVGDTGDHDMASFEPDMEGYALESCSCERALSPDDRRAHAPPDGPAPISRTIEGLTVLNAGTLVRIHDPGVLVADFSERTVEQWRLLPEISRISTWP